MDGDAERLHVRAEFLARFTADAEKGGARPLEEYQASWPGFEALIAREFRRLTREGSSVPEDTEDTNAREEAEDTGSPVERFLKQYRKDREADAVLNLGAYLRMFPGDSRGIAAEYQTLEIGETDEDPDRVGPYRLEKLLGSGGQGDVYLATDTRHGRRVAVKVLKVLTAKAAETVERQLSRFRREAKLGARLDHPGICPVYDSGVAGRRLYIAMRYVEGTTVAERISTQKSLQESDGPTAAKRNVPANAPPWASTPHLILDPPSDAPGGSDAADRTTTDSTKAATPMSATSAEIEAVIRFFEDAARALHAAHEKGVIHRDIKPGNIMIDTDQRPVIMDFGLARSDDEDLVTVTRQGDLFGTAAYMSPEQLTQHAIRLDRRTDVWSLGVSLYEALTLHRPFEAPTREARYEQILARDPAHPRVWNPAISADLATVVLKSLEKGRDRRYESAAALADELRRVRRHEPILARPDAPLGRLLRWRQRNPALAAALAAVVLVLLLGAVVSTFFAIQANLNAEKAKDNAQAASANAAQAQANADHADRNLKEWSRLADGRVLSDLLREAEEDLWPAVPAKIGAIETWIRNAEALVARLPDHERALAAVRDQARPHDAAAQAHDRASFGEENSRLEIIENDLGNLTAEEEEVSASRQAAEEATAKAVEAGNETRAERAQARIDEAEENAASLQERRTTLETERAALTGAIEKRVTWSFEDPDLRFRHDRLKELVEGLASLEGPANPQTVTLAGMVARLSLARSLEETQVSEGSAWAQAAASIKQPDGPYGGLILSPMAGLVPLGIDEDSKLWEFWHMASGSRPLWVGRPLGPGKVQFRSADDAAGKVGDEGLVLVLLPGGTFRMGARVPDDDHPLGSPNVDPIAQTNESPVHDVTLAPFLLSKDEVTQGQWARLWGSNPSTYVAGQQYGPGRVTVTLRNPVTSLNWDQARETCRRWNLELPTEARWEFACRGGTGHVYWTGNNLGSLKGAANFADRTAARFTIWQTEPDFEDGHVVHAPVDALRANGFGLHHVHGNVWEWCLDGYYGYDAWRSVRSGDGLRGPVGGARSRVYRGGGFYDFATCARSANRSWNDPGSRNFDLGFRPALGIEK
jgi:serine/threonine protein kinase/formylglycine-generating enzyme required for sulfatase activity